MYAASTDTGLLFQGPEWSFELLEKTREAIQDIALNDLGLDVYPNQIEIISAEQMLDAYSCVGLPLMYQHWSFGKHFARDEALYRTGRQGLAYEIVINSNPCISYNMEENTMAMQTLVMAHAAFGHNHFFKNNYLFQQWTDAEGIHDYLAFAKNYIAACEERYGWEAVEEVLDAAHALQTQGVFRYGRPPKPSTEERVAMAKMREAYEAGQSALDIWTDATLGLRHEEKDLQQGDLQNRRDNLNLPQENILYFLEKHSPILEPWQREILRIVRMLAQYLYPQKQTKVMNEGCATFVHYYIINELFEQGKITQGALMEMLHSHTNVVMQPEFDDPRFGGINPYALGFAMMQDIRRICEEPSQEDKEWFPEFAGNPDWRGVMRGAWANYRDESFIQQYLSPHLMRKFKLFTLTDNEDSSKMVVTQIHNRAGYKSIRRDLARQYDLAYAEPDIQVTDADLRGDRVLRLTHTVRDGVHLAEKDKTEVLKHLRRLWGYEVTLAAVEYFT